MMDEKRLFFGIEVDAPWPQDLPSGRILEEKERHITLAFLGKVDYSNLKEILAHFPTPEFKVGFVGKFDQCLFFPKRHPRVVAWHALMVEKNENLIQFQNVVATWLQENGYAPDNKHDFTPHVTLAREPFSISEWKQAFHPLPFFLKDIHLYESLGHSKFSSLWHFPVLAPIESIDHTADLAYWIRGENYGELFLHGAYALAFTFPSIMNFILHKPNLISVYQVIHALNEMIFNSDKEIGCPFKAVSFHTDMKKENQILQWEMIVDV